MALYAGIYEQTDFEFNGRLGMVVAPKNPRQDKKYIWRTEFVGAFDSADREMLARGYYLVHYKVSNMYGCPESVEEMHKFHLHIIEKYGFPKTAIMFGFSRGGLYACNYAAAYPEYTSLLYLDAPVMDIRSWPAGYGKGVGAPKEWEECKGWYKLDESTAKDFDGNPNDKVDLISVPVIIVAGLADATVPYEENGAIFAKSYKGKLKTILKPDCGHHPHSLSDPRDICDFIEANC